MLLLPLGIYNQSNIFSGVYGSCFLEGLVNIFYTTVLIIFAQTCYIPPHLLIDHSWHCLWPSVPVSYADGQFSFLQTYSSYTNSFMYFFTTLSPNIHYCLLMKTAVSFLVLNIYIIVLILNFNSRYNFNEVLFAKNVFLISLNSLILFLWLPQLQHYLFQVNFN